MDNNELDTKVKEQEDAFKEVSVKEKKVANMLTIIIATCVAVILVIFASGVYRAGIFSQQLKHTAYSYRYSADSPEAKAGQGQGIIAILNKKVYLHIPEKKELKPEKGDSYTMYLPEDIIVNKPIFSPASSTIKSSQLKEPIKILSNGNLEYMGHEFVKQAKVEEQAWMQLENYVDQLEQSQKQQKELEDKNKNASQSEQKNEGNSENNNQAQNNNNQKGNNK